MTLNSELIGLADGFRSLYGTDGKYSISDMKQGITNLQIHNYIDSSIVLDTKNGYVSSVAIPNFTPSLMNDTFVGKKVTLSFDVDWSNYNPSDTDQEFRFGVEMQTTTNDGLQHWNNCWFNFTDRLLSGHKHVYNTFIFSSSPVKSIGSFNIINHLNKDAQVKIYNVKMVLNPMGGGRK